MKKYIKEIIIGALQLFMFYIFPLFAGPTDAMGMVFLIIIATLSLSVVLALLSEVKYRFLYPVITAVIFVPSVFIYYNESALVHSLWYLAVSSAGMAVGALVRFGVKAIIKAKKEKK